MVLQLFKLPDGSVKALVEGEARVRAGRLVAAEPHFVVEYALVESPDRASARSRSLARRVADEFVRYVQLHPQLADEAQFAVQKAADPGRASPTSSPRICRSPARRSRRCSRS